MLYDYENADLSEQNVAASTFDYLYDFTVDNLLYSETDTYSSQVLLDAELDGFTFESGFTKSNTMGSDSVALTSNHPDKFGTASTGSAAITDSNKKITFSGLNAASYYVKLSDNLSNNFQVSPEEYVYISFKIENNLSRLGNTDVSVFVIDEEGNYNTVGTYSDIDNASYCRLVVKNRYPENDPEATAESFSLFIAVGPTDVKNSDVQNDCASGSVVISNIEYYKNTTNQYVKDAAGNYQLLEAQKIKTPNYSLYSLFASSCVDVSVDDYVSETADSYALSSAKSAAGNTYTAISDVYGYTGIVSDHTYLKTDSTNSKINDRSGEGDALGNYAGLINSEYVAGYSVPIASTIAEKLNYSGENKIQPIMIYNSTLDNYGFVGTSFNVAASTNAKISVRVRATDAAKAFVYLIDTADSDKPIATFGFEKGNVEGDATYGEAFSKKLSFEGIDKDDMGANGWFTASFYIATGANAKNLRLELWNGSRDGAEKSQGYVFFSMDSFNDTDTFVASSLSGAFTEPTTATEAYNTSGNPLYDIAFTAGAGRAFIDSAVKYVRELDSTEITYNSEDHDNTISYEANYVWASSFVTGDGVIYAVYNTVNPVAVDPYATEEAEEETGCAAQTDPSAFWLSFSSIVLGVVLVLAIIMLVVKGIRRKRKANKKDGKSHYKVSSRYKAKAPVKQKAPKAVKVNDDVYEDDIATDTKAEEQNVANADDANVAEEQPTDNSNDYIYGDVQDFGDNTNDNVDKEPTSDEPENENK